MSSAIGGPAGAAELVLPAPASGGAEALSLKVDVAPRPDGAFDAVVTLALVNPGTTPTQAALTLPALALSSVEVGGATVPPPAGGTLPVDLEPGEALAARMTFRLEPDLLDWLPESDAGWLGRTRGALLQPAYRLVVRHPDGSAFGSRPVSVRVAPGGSLPVSALFQDPPGHLATGEASWVDVTIVPPARLTLAWPVLESEIVPRDRAEAQALAEVLRKSDVPSGEVDRVRAAVAASAEPGARAADEVLAAVTGGRARPAEPATTRPSRPTEDIARREREAQAARQAEEVARAEQAEREAAAIARQAEEIARAEQAEREAAAVQQPIDVARLARLEVAADQIRERQALEAIERAMRALPAGAVPWIRSPLQARVFLDREREAETLSKARVEEAIALIRAHWGESFQYEPRWRDRFAEEAWYAPRRSNGLLPPTEGEVAALEVLAAAM